MARILVIDSLDGDRVRDALMAHKHTVVIVSTVADGLEAVSTVAPHLIVMDHVLSDGNGLMLLPKLGRVPLIVLSAADDQQTRVMALRAGADDFIGKPWDDDDLAERVAAVVRRSYRKVLQANEVLTVGELAIAYGAVNVGGVGLKLTKTEHMLLVAVASQAGRVVPRDEIIEAMYGPGEINDWHSVVVHLGRLCRKLRTAGVRRAMIRTVRGRGLTMEK